VVGWTETPLGSRKEKKGERGGGMAQNKQPGVGIGGFVTEGCVKGWGCGGSEGTKTGV